MAERRMFNKQITRSDAFLDMPRSTRLLYYDLNLDADDDGFIDKYKSIMRLTGASEDDLKILIAKSFIIPFENGLIVIKHWRMNNLIRNDRYKPTVYQEEKKQLVLKENGSYTKTTVGIPNVNQVDTQYSIGKDSIVEDSIVEKEAEASTPPLKTKKIYAPDSVLIEMLNNSELSEDVKASLKDWLSYKTERKDKYTEKGFSSLLTITNKKCLTYGDKAVIDLIEECESNLWAGIIWDKLTQRNKGQTQIKPTKLATPNKYIREE